MVCPNKDEVTSGTKNIPDKEQLNFFDQYFDYYIEMRNWSTFFFVPNQLKQEFYDNGTFLRDEQKLNENLVKSDFHMMNV